eukprot:TRINITY_DN4436_c0_g1_i2.p1 TRINITY_DN4436_c0_g1~~TRINITY_DN4436_c0_g1_i2.p1  ORF type:complete len:249 (-),score=85.61 TRINITY_DN4436_c0_g1_i2:97-843(-)
MAEGGEIECVLLDIEGTTTPISFVADVLFPFARAHAHRFLSSRAQLDEYAPLFRVDRAVAAEGCDAASAPPPIAPPSASDGDVLDSVVCFIHWMMDRDLKVTTLKKLQGEIWKSGYESGELVGRVFEDVVPNLEGWKAKGVRTYIYSSGSVAAQKLLFGYSEHGDLLPLLCGHFDTNVGPKREAASYERIALAIGCAPSRVMFATDVCEEAHAARAAHMRTTLIVRPGNKPLPPHHSHRTLPSLNTLL